MALQFIGWLKHHLDRKTFEGCVWVDRSQNIFKISWPRAEKSLTPEKLGVMYKWWTHKFGSTRNQNQPTAIKGNFRSCLNSKVQSQEIRKLKNMDKREDADDWKVFQFLDSDRKNTNRQTAINKRRNMPEEEAEDEGVDTSPYEPPDSYAHEYIKDERKEVDNETKTWAILITAHAKNMKVWEHVYNWKRESNGKTKLHVFLSGDARRVAKLPAWFDMLLPGAAGSLVNSSAPIDASCNPVFTKKHAPDPSKPEYEIALTHTFCPGFLLEVDEQFNIWITRLCQMHLSYGHHGLKDKWQRLAALRNPDMYKATDDSSKGSFAGGVKQMIFSYSKFVHQTKVYENWREKAKDRIGIDLIDPEILLAVDQPPPIGKGCDSHCDFWFKIEHMPARKRINDIFKETGVPAQINISEDPDGLWALNEGLGGMSLAPVKQAGEDNKTNMRTFSDTVGPGAFDNPGPDVWRRAPQEMNVGGIIPMAVDQRQGIQHPGHVPSSYFSPYPSGSLTDGKETIIDPIYGEAVLSNASLYSPISDSTELAWASSPATDYGDYNALSPESVLSTSTICENIHPVHCNCAHCRDLQNMQ